MPIFIFKTIKLAEEENEIFLAPYEIKKEAPKKNLRDLKYSHEKQKSFALIKSSA